MSIHPTPRRRSAAGSCRAFWFDVPDRRVEIDGEISFEDADGGGVGAGFFDGDGVDGVVVGEGEDVIDGEAGEVAKGVFEDGFGVGDVEEGGVLGLELDEGAGGEGGGFDLEEVAGFEGEGL